MRTSYLFRDVRADLIQKTLSDFGGGGCLIDEMQERSDVELLRQYADQASEAAFREIVTRHADLVYAAALRQVRSPELAQDIAQTVFTDLLRKAPSLGQTLSENASLVGWLYRSTRFAAHKRLRDDWRRQARERQAMDNLDTTSETATEWDRVGPVLDEAMADLSDEDREALLLRFFKNHDFRAIGLSLGVSDDAAQKRVSRALERLRAEFNRRGVTTTALALSTAVSANAVSVAPAGLAASIAGTALAGAAIGGPTLPLLKVMGVTKLKVGVIGAIVVAGVATPLVFQHLTKVKLAEQNRSLQQQIQNLGEIKTDNERLSNALAEARSANPASPEDQFREILRLRGEVGLLRRRNAELALLTNQQGRAEQTFDQSHPSLFALRMVTDFQTEGSQKYTMTKPITGTEYKTAESLFLENRTLMDHTSISSAAVSTNLQTGQRRIDINLTPDGAARFSILTRGNINKRIAIFMNGELCVSPFIRSEITSATIPVDVPFSEPEARELVQKINETALKQ